MNALSLEQINTISLFTEKACRPDKQRDFRHLLKSLSVLSAFMLKFSRVVERENVVGRTLFTPVPFLKLE